MNGVLILSSCAPGGAVIDWPRLMGRIDEDSIRRVLEALLGKIRRKIRSELEHGLVPLGISNLLLG